jgi:hypothetical protein
MPCKNRGPAIVLVLALLVGLVGQAAVALPHGSRPAIAESSAGSFFTGFWGWLTERWSNLGQGPSTPAQAREKSGASNDPNNGPKAPAPCVHPGD